MILGRVQNILMLMEVFRFETQDPHCRRYLLDQNLLLLLLLLHLLKPTLFRLKPWLRSRVRWERLQFRRVLRLLRVD